MASLLENPQCCIKTLVINKCNLGLSGIIQIMKQLADCESLEEINLAENTEPEELKALVDNSTYEVISGKAGPGTNPDLDTEDMQVDQKPESDHPEQCILETNDDLPQIVADTESMKMQGR